MKVHNDNPYIVNKLLSVSGATWNSPSNAGTKRTMFNSTNPTPNAAHKYLLENNSFDNTCFLDLLLNPWTSLDKH